MATISKKEEKEKELYEFIDSKYVDRVVFSLTELLISIVFINQKKLNIKFKRGSYRFKELILKNSEIDINNNGVLLTEEETDKAMLSFIYNILNRKSESLIFYCERLITELDKGK